MSASPPFTLACPLPSGPPGEIRLAHGAGGLLSRELLERVILPALDGGSPDALHDGAVLDAGALGAGERLAFTTDSYTVSPRRFPGGDIGRLAVCGTVNDLAMCGARPLALSLAFVLEEGLPIAELDAVARSVGETARAAGVRVATGDTKVVERGGCDGLYVTTSGVGAVPAGVDVHPRRVAPGDVVLLSGDVARHGMAVMSAREDFLAAALTDDGVTSDVAPLAGAVARLLDAGVDPHCLRDATRGGLAAALCEIATAAGVRIDLRERDVAVLEAVHGLCELLGIDPLHVANEGCFVAVVARWEAERALAALRAEPVSAGAVAIGEVRAGEAGLVVATTAIGGERVIDLPSGELLPRIC